MTQRIKIQVYLNAEGAEALAKGRGVESLYSWHINVRATSEEGEFSDLPNRAIFLGEMIADLPPRSKVLEIAIKDLDRRIQEVYANAEIEIKELRERLESLLAIGWEGEEE